MIRSLILLCLLCSGASAGTLVQFRTSLGDVHVELFDEDKPLTVRNFLRYANSGAYTNMFLHRCIPGFVVQGGGFATSTPASSSAFNSYSSVPALGPITNEFSAGEFRSNVYGTIAMAKVGGDPHSATSQWFFNLGNNAANLDNQNGGFTVFGRVVRGTNVLNQFNALGYGNGIVDMQWWYGPGNASLFSDLPVNYAGFAHPRFLDLIYCEISVLKVQVNATNGGARELVWNSVAGATNIVEFSNQLPPVWQPLIRTNATGGEVRITDSSGAGATRFYRLRVEF